MGLVFNNISKHYGAVTAIKKADMLIEDGEVRAILGGNGSGKSTLAKVISGLIGRNSGEILIDGKAVDFASPKDAKKHHVIMTSQELSLFTNLTVEDNICICNLPVNGIFTSKRKLKERACSILQRMNLTSLIGKKVSELPPNHQYMVEFAKALIQEPRILVIDEITSALYREDVEIVDGIIRELKGQGCITLFISHRMGELYAMCDSVTIMRNGETLGTYPMNEKTEDELLSLMVGNKIESCHRTHRLADSEEKSILISAPGIAIPSYGSTEKLDIEKGEIIGVAGLQGHGQTDLLRSLYGLNGTIRLTINGKPSSISSAKSAVTRGFAYLSGDREHDGTFSERNLTENLGAVKELVKHSKLGDPDTVLQELHVRYDNAGELITSLSGGNQQKVVVGRWLTSAPLLLLADDPTKGIDVKARRDIHQEIAKLAKSGSAVVMISSDNDELVDITSLAEVSKVIVMYEGHISAILRGDEICRENISAASMPVEKEGTTND
jgi:ABC-type sugar transport system ATPase subunit